MSKPDLKQLVGKNQSIKIVPSIEDSLRALGLNVELDDNTLIWYQQLKTTWKTWKKSTTLEKHIELFFQNVLDPFRVALIFVIKSEDVKDCKPKSLPYFIVETLEKWSLESGQTPDNTLKMPAFHIAIQQRNNHFLNLLVKTYHVQKIKKIIIPIVKDMIKNDNCKLASQVVIATELYEDIPVEYLLFPLILQDKTNLIDEYLTECPSQVQPFLLFLDNLLDKAINLKEYAQKYIEEHKICHIKYEKIHYKPLGKLVARLCNKFNIPIETCKNLSKNRTTGGLKYLIHQKYQEHNVSSSVWDDLVKDSLRQNAGSAQEFIDLLVDYDKNEARKWADYLHLPEDSLPLALREMSLQDESVDENWDTEQNSTQEYYKLSLPEEHVVLIDTGEKFYDLMTLLGECSLVSIDCEWKPSFGAKQSQVALIQIATQSNVYLIDALLLNSQSYSSFWYTFYKSFLDNAEIIKLGFGLEQDLKEMKASIIGLGNIKVKGEGMLDLCTLWKNLLNSGMTVPSCDEHTGNSLSNLVQSCFGLPLEKSEQCSNWELRPLRKTQILYAALDAYVLVEIFNYLQKKCEEQEINFEEIYNGAMQEPKKKLLKKVKVFDRASPLMPSIHSKTTNDIKLLVEPKLSQLMAYLRYCGIDTTVMPETMLWCDVINLAMSEERLILLIKHKGTPNVNFPQSSIVNIGKGTIIDQLQKIFLLLNVGIKQTDLFKYCIKCNDKDLTILSPNEVEIIYKEYKAANTNTNSYTNSNSYTNNYRCDYDNYDLNYDNFLSDSDCDEELYQVENVIKPNSSYKTKKGVLLQIENINSLSNKPGIMCETCGTLFRDDDPLTKSVINTIQSLTNLSIW